MRLAINGRFLTQDVTGVQRVAIEFVTALDAMIDRGDFPGLEVEILVPGGSAAVTDLDLSQVRTRHVGGRAGLWWEQVSLPLAARGRTLLGLGNLAPVASLLRRRHHTFTMVHDLSYRYFPAAYTLPFRALHRALIPAVLRWSTAVFTVSQSERKAICAAHPRITDGREPVAVQNGGGELAAGRASSADPETLRPGADAVPAGDVRPGGALYVGSLTRRKNADGLAAVARELVDHDDVTFTFVGGTGEYFASDGSTEDDPRIRRLGQVNDAETLEAEYRAARAFVFPSFYEASPLPPIEAMALGCPVVAADIPSLRERCGDAALYCDPSDIESILTATRRLLTDGALWSRMQRKGLTHAQRFTWESQVRAVMTRILAEGAPA